MKQITGIAEGVNVFFDQVIGKINYDDNGKALWYIFQRILLVSWWY